MSISSLVDRKDSVVDAVVEVELSETELCSVVEGFSSGLISEEDFSVVFSEVGSGSDFGSGSEVGVGANLISAV